MSPDVSHRTQSELEAGLGAIQQAPRDLGTVALIVRRPGEGRRETLPTGTRLQIGTAIVEVTGRPHTGCAKFQQRFGADAVRFVNSPVGRLLRLRGLNARVVHAGAVGHGDAVHNC